MLDTLSGMSMAVRPVQSLKASEPILVTGSPSKLSGRFSSPVAVGEQPVISM